MPDWENDVTERDPFEWEWDVVLGNGVFIGQVPIGFPEILSPRLNTVLEPASILACESSGLQAYAYVLLPYFPNCHITCSSCNNELMVVIRQY